MNLVRLTHEARKNGINISMMGMKSRIERGFSEKEAVTTPLNRNRKSKKKVYCLYEGDKYVYSGTIDECAKHLNIKKSTLYSYITHTKNGVKKGRYEIYEIE